jgi:hypothetical protein
MAFVTNAYIESVLSEETRNGLLSNQGTYDASTATETINYLIGDADAKVLSACWQQGVRSPGARDLLRAVAGALVVVALYGRNGLDAPQQFKDAAAMLDLIRSGELPIPEEIPSLIDGPGGASFSTYEPAFGSGKIKF